MKEIAAVGGNAGGFLCAQVTSSIWRSLKYENLLPAAIPQCIDQSVHLLGRVNDIFAGQMHGDFDFLPSTAVIFCIANGGFEGIEFNCGSVSNPELHGALRFTIV
nr:hypothetical protein [Rhizobium sp. ICMP 5592]